MDIDYSELQGLNNDYAKKYGFSSPSTYLEGSRKGLSESLIREISEAKAEPEWMLDFRLKALEMFLAMPDPAWIDSEIFDSIDYDDLFYYARAADKQYNDWNEVPEDIKATFQRLGVPEAERKFLAGVSAQFESEVVYHNIQEELKRQGVIFLDFDSGLRKYGDLIRRYIGTLVPPDDNKFAALNSAAWSGGSFVYVPPNVTVDIPLQAYFRINAESMGQFERTIIIADKNASVHYIEGCTAPVYSKTSFHTGVIELFALEGASLRYTTVQNWSKNVLNLVTQRSVAKKDASIEWLDGNLGSKTTMKYPAVYLSEPGARGRVLSVGFANKGRRQDAGAKIIHAAPRTSSVISAKSISQDGGRSSYRGLVKVLPGIAHVKSSVECDALLLDGRSRSDTYPTMDSAGGEEVLLSHEARVGRVGDEELFYLMSRGISRKDAVLMVINGFISEFTRELPMEYAVELNRLIELEMEGGIG